MKKMLFLLLSCFYYMTNAQIIDVRKSQSQPLLHYWSVGVGAGRVKDRKSVV